MTRIDVTRSGADEYSVVVSENGSTSRHVVTAVDGLARARHTTSERLVEASVLFLLDREPKEAILSRFDLGIIDSYFPEYDSAIGDYLARV